jgi:tetratricopeptide (TPR) repeat protein/transcriptional regulator with XRE-family HTH domain
MGLDSFQLADVLGKFVARSGYTAGQLARLSSIPKPTIVNWLEGRVKRPRTREDLLRLAVVLHLDRAELSELLVSAGHPDVDVLERSARQTNDTEALALLRPWLSTAVSPHSPAPQPAPFQVMADLPTFVGREEEIAQLRARLSEPTHPTLYAIHGMGGVGKTALAVKMAYLMRGNFPDGVLWARVNLSDTLSILGTFASAYQLDVSQYSDLHSRSRVVRDLLGRKRALIILDGAERSEQIAPLLPPTGGCAVIVTTRRQDLSVLRGAYRLHLSPFSPQTGEALALFARVLGNGRVQAEKHLFTQLAQLLGYLPLAIDIAAARLAYEPGWSTAEFLTQLQQTNQRLHELAFDQQSVRLSFETSYAALSPEEQHCFAALSVFVGEDFSEAAAAAVTQVSRAEMRRMLHHFYALSLVQTGRPALAGQPARYRLHQLLRDFAREKLVDDTAVTQRMIAYYTQFADTHARHYPLLEMEKEHIETAVNWAMASGMADACIQGIQALYHFWESRGLYKTAESLLAPAQSLVPPEDTANRMKLHHYMGRVTMRLGEYIEAETQFEQALELARQLEDEGHLSHILRTLGVLAARRGDYGLAEAYYKEGLLLARTLGMGSDVSQFLRGLGVQAYMRGDFARAEAFYEEGLGLMEMEAADGAEQAHAAAMLWGLGVLAEEQGDFHQALLYFSEALILARQTGHLEREILLLRSLGRVYQALDLGKQAYAVLQEAFQLASDIGHRWYVARTLADLGRCELALGEWDTAVDTFTDLYTQARILQSQEMIADALFGLAQIAAHHQDWQKARQKAAQALDTYIAIGHHEVQRVQAWLKGLPVEG